MSTSAMQGGHNNELKRWITTEICCNKNTISQTSSDMMNIRQPRSLNQSEVDQLNTTATDKTQPSSSVTSPHLLLPCQFTNQTLLKSVYFWPSYSKKNSKGGDMFRGNCGRRPFLGLLYRRAISRILMSCTVGV